MSEGKSETASSYSGWQFLRDIAEMGKEQQSKVVEAAQVEGPCTHQGHYRVTASTVVTVRYCTNCGKSWTMAKAQYEDVPVWKAIKEYAESRDALVE